MVGYVILNPGCAPRVPQYFNIADLVIVYEHFHDKFISPPKDDSFFGYLDKVDNGHGQRLMLPQISNHFPSSKYGVMIHDTKFKSLDDLRHLVTDLIQIKGISALFITDIEIEKKDIYADWSSYFPEFISMVNEANNSLLF
jgi:hypothetical protein